MLGSHKSCDIAEGDGGNVMASEAQPPSNSVEQDAIASASLIIVAWERAKDGGSVTNLPPGEE
jgi:hypothetical protein